MDIVERLRRINAFLHITEDEPEYDYRLSYDAANEIERLRREVADLEEIMDREKCALGYLITKRALKKFGAWNP